MCTIVPGGVPSLSRQRLRMCDRWSCCLDDRVLWLVVKVHPRRLRLAETEEWFTRIFLLLLGKQEIEGAKVGRVLHFLLLRPSVNAITH